MNITDTSYQYCILPPPPFTEGGAYCFTVVGIPQTNWRTVNPIDFKFGTLINTNMKIVPITRQVKAKAIFTFVGEGGISVLQISPTLFYNQIIVC